jgi:hypothetical protein
MHSASVGSRPECGEIAGRLYFWVLITLAATLSVVPAIPVAGLALILGVDRFLAEIRTATNFIGNGVAAVVISRWEGELDAGKLSVELGGRSPAPIEIPGSRKKTERAG